MNAKQLTASILLSALLLGGFTGCETNKSKDNKRYSPKSTQMQIFM